MEGAGLYVESAKGECNLGQHEIAFRYAEALTTCDNHVIYKEGAKEIAAQEGMALTFMAKFNEREGNSCHIHISVRGDGNLYADDETVMVDATTTRHALSPLGASFIAGQLAHLRELTLMFAPNINSYKRFVPGSFAPTTVAWGRDNRTCAITARRPRARACAWRTGCPVATSTPTSQPLPSSRRASMASNADSSWIRH